MARLDSGLGGWGLQRRELLFPRPFVAPGCKKRGGGRGGGRCGAAGTASGTPSALLQLKKKTQLQIHILKALSPRRGYLHRPHTRRGLPSSRALTAERCQIAISPAPPPEERGSARPFLRCSLLPGSPLPALGFAALGASSTALCRHPGLGAARSVLLFSFIPAAELQSER